MAIRKNAVLLSPIDPRVTVSYLGKGTMPRLRKTIVQSFNPLRKYLKQNQIDVCLLQTTDMGIIAPRWFYGTACSEAEIAASLCFMTMEHWQRS